MDGLDKQYKEWLEQQTFENVDEDWLREKIIDELTTLSSMSVEEYTLFKKWIEINKKYPIENVDPNPWFTSTPAPPYPEIKIVRSEIWIPESPEDYKKLDPYVVLCSDSNQTRKWNILRTFICTLENNSNIGRNLRFLIVDGSTNKYLGVICVSSDFMDLTPRDNHIGWSREIKTKQKMINHTAIGSSIVPTQPLGYNYLGGKLLALLTTSFPVEAAWDSRYGDKLVGITTTSLYGSFSQYNSLKYWGKKGHSSGKIKYVPSKEIMDDIRDWMKLKHPRRYWELWVAKNPQGLPLKRDHKQRTLAFVYRQFKIPKEIYEADHKRGIYWCPLFNNTNEFLRKEIGAFDLVKRFDNSVDALTKIWKEKYAIKRISKLKDPKFTTLFYDDMIGAKWENVKKKYLEEVGR